MPLPPINNEPFSLLVVEDDDVDAMIITRMFEAEPDGTQATGPKVNVYRAHDGVEGLEMLKSLSDRGVTRLLVLLDINMPRMNGLEFLEAVRAEPGLEPTLIFVMTTSVDSHDVQAAYRANVAGYFEKPMGGSPAGRIKELLCEYAGSVIFPQPPALKPIGGGPRSRTKVLAPNRKARTPHWSNGLEDLVECPPNSTALDRSKVIVPAHRAQNPPLPPVPPIPPVPLGA